MNVTIHYTNGETGDFAQIDDVKTVNDIAYLDGVMHTNVEDLRISA